MQTEPEPAPEPVEDSTGPNHIWHMIGFMKMAEFGLEMYAAIDEYSRYVLWIYVGVPSRTAVSVYRQYLDAVSDSKHLPQIVRTNLHAETTLVGDAHWALRRASHPEVAQADCYSSGGSGGNSENNRRDSWWSQLSKSSVFIWRVSCYLFLLSSADCDVRLLNLDPIRIISQAFKISISIRKRASPIKSLYSQYSCQPYAHRSIHMSRPGIATRFANNQNAHG
jgi:hypothetical protein